jgi:AraC-like DNA-binding protein
VARELGVVANHARADLVLVERDPLSDVRNLSRIAGVMLRGRWLDRRALDDRLHALRSSYAPPRDRFASLPALAAPGAATVEWRGRWTVGIAGQPFGEERALVARRDDGTRVIVAQAVNDEPDPSRYHAILEAGDGNGRSLTLERDDGEGRGQVTLSREGARLRVRGWTPYQPAIDETRPLAPTTLLVGPTLADELLLFARLRELRVGERRALPVAVVAFEPELTVREATWLVERLTAAPERLRIEVHALSPGDRGDPRRRRAAALVVGGGAALRRRVEEPAMTSDTLSDVLRAVRLTGAVFFSVDASEPWVAETPPARELGPYLMPGVEHVIEYHAVTSGVCWGGLVDEMPVQLQRGDIIVFPQGDRHVMSSAPGMRGPFDEESYRRARLGNLPVSIKLEGGGSGRTELICGFLGCDARPFNPLLATLPRLIHVRRQPDGILEQLVRTALAESTAKRAGGEVVLARLSELLFVEVVRRHLATLAPQHSGWLAGLRDDSIGRALGKLHERPEHGWTLDELAREVGVSRSVLAERFSHFVGVPPMQYLGQWRMQLAARLLAGTSLSLAEIASRVGYGSETALSRAYKRWVGVTPADWRRGKRSSLG